MEFICDMQITINGESLKIDVDWKLEAPLFHASLKHKSAKDNKTVTIQYLERDTLGYVLQHYGTKVGSKFLKFGR